MTDAAPKRIWEFDRYINGVLMAEGVTVEKQPDIASAMKAAAIIASRGPHGEVPVLIVREGASEHAALIREAEAERDEAQRLMQMRHREMLAADELMRKHQGRAVAAEAERDRLAAANAALEAQVGARRAERDQLRAAVEGLIAVLDRNGEKGPIPDVEMMFCWLAAQNVRAAFRNTEGRGDMTDDEALETLFAMANVQDGYAKKATDRGLKIIHKANAKAQREVAATINDLRARLASAEADRDRLAAANAVLEAKVAGLRSAFRVNMLRFGPPGTSHEEIDAAIDAALATQEAGT